MLNIQVLLEDGYELDLIVLEVFEMHVVFHPIEISWPECKPPIQYNMHP